VGTYNKRMKVWSGYIASFVVVFCVCFSFRQALGEPLRVVIIPQKGTPFTNYNLGTCTAPDGSTLSVDSQSLFLNGRRWFPIMGEFHFARYPSKEWRVELLKMKAGGVDIVSTYVFWIFHEEIEGQYDWAGSRDLRQFVKLCGELGLKVVVRVGPWCHGEVRNGGFPDWLMKKGWRLRSDDTNYLAKVREFYGQIARQLDGLLWKNGGPVIGIQLENEYRGFGGHLVMLKQIARDVGLDVPLYTRTGWPALARPVPIGEIFPMYGVYAEGFWDRELVPMPGRYWAGFHFSHLRMDENIANEMLGRRQVKDEEDVQVYPYLTCEVGSGMMNSYHRRLKIDPEDVEAITLVKLGSGSVLLGYYMYHGGVNPDGKLTTLNESQANNEWNDLPVKNYDFQAPLGQYGQVRPHYHLLRRMHLFLHDWGEVLAGMRSYLPESRPIGKSDVTNLRWAVRANDQGGVIFVNNYQRLQPMPAKSNVQFKIELGGQQFVVPNEPLTIPADVCFFWPFNFNVGSDITLGWATAQPVCKSDESEPIIYFRSIPGILPVFAFKIGPKLPILELNKGMGNMVTNNGMVVVTVTNTGPWVAFTAVGSSGQRTRFCVLTDKQSLRIWKIKIGGRKMVVYSESNLYSEGNTIVATSTNVNDFMLGLPVDVTLRKPWRRIPGWNRHLHADAYAFNWWVTEVKPISEMNLLCKVQLVRAPGLAPKVRFGQISQPVATQPLEEDFQSAGQWRITVPPHIPRPAVDMLLNISYVGDVARVSHHGNLLIDDFYNGLPLEIGLARYLGSMKDGVSDLLILPLQVEGSIFIDPRTKPQFSPEVSQLCELKEIRLSPVYQVKAIVQRSRE